MLAEGLFMKKLLIIIAVVWILFFNLFFIIADYRKSPMAKVRYTVESKDVFYKMRFDYK